MTRYPVSRETRARLETFVTTLASWSRRHNLVATGTLDQVWSRHVDDSLQLIALAPDPPTPWVDIGSGAGLPGLVVAAALPPGSVTLVESDGRKCAFLRHAADAMGVNVHVRHQRIEAAADDLNDLQPKVLSARALASLDRLLTLGAPLLERGAIGLFPKGMGFADELTKARESWRFSADVLPSDTDSKAAIIRISEFHGPAGIGAGGAS